MADVNFAEDSVEEVNGPKEFVNAELAVFAGKDSWLPLQSV